MTNEQTIITLLDRISRGQVEQNALLQTIATSLTAERQNRQAQLDKWKASNPRLAASCREALTTWAKIQEGLISDFTEEIIQDSEQLESSQFSRREMIERYGQMVIYLNHLGTILEQLGGPSASPPGKGP